MLSSEIDIEFLNSSKNYQSRQMTWPGAYIYIVVIPLLNEHIFASAVIPHDKRLSQIKGPEHISLGLNLTVIDIQTE